MKDWRLVDQLDDAEKPESVEYIRAKYGAGKMSQKKAVNYVYFKCTKNCGFLLRWVKRTGALEALREHNHPLDSDLRKNRKKRAKLDKNAKEIESKYAVLPNNKERISQLTSTVPLVKNSVPTKNNLKKPTTSSNSAKKNTATDDPLEQFCQIDLNKKKWWNDLDNVVFMSDEQLEEYVAKQKAQFITFKEWMNQILLATTKANKDKRGAYWDKMQPAE